MKTYYERKDMLELIREFENIVKQCAEKGLATEMILVEAIPNLRNKFNLWEHIGCEMMNFNEAWENKWSLYEPIQTLSDKIITGYPISSDERLAVKDVKEALSRFIDKTNSKLEGIDDFKDSDMFKDLKEIFGDRLILK